MSVPAVVSPWIAVVPLPSKRWILLGLALALLGAGLALAVERGPGERREDRPPPTLADYWAGRAALVLDRQWTSTSLGAPSGAHEGAHVEVVGSTWYLFNRRTEAGTCPGRAPNVRPLSTQVRASTDRGATWGPPRSVVSPAAGTPWSCAATDGDATFDAETQTWRYLFQCLGDTGPWNGCLVRRRGQSPLGPWEAPADVPNPVIAPGLLWSEICDDEGDECRRAPGQQRIADEGTFDVFEADGDGWWVSFHGYDGRFGFRGIARTQTFRPGDWEVDGAGGTPSDAVIDAGDAAGWRETWAPGGPVGAGAGRIVAQDGWHYQVAEVPDEDLACRSGQNWDFGLFRTDDLASTRWQQLPAGNPIVYSSRKADGGDRAPGCNVLYPGLFTDPETEVTYLMHGRVASDPARDGIYLHRLEWDENLLRNGDLRTAESAPWLAFPGTTTQLVAERSTPTSLDGTPDLAFNCGAPTCSPEASVYQDVEVPARLHGREVDFGGAFRGDAEPGRLELTLFELGADGAVVRETAVPVSASIDYAAVRRTVELDPRTRRLRLQVFPRSPGTLRADDLFVIDQEGCTTPRFPAC